MKGSYTFGSLNNDYAMSFQMNSDNDRGFWWGDDAHTDAQGAMSLSTNGKLSVATAIRVGHGESDTALAGSSYGADFAGTGIFYGGLRANAGFGVNTAAGPTGTIRATSDITAYYSDERLKEKISSIDSALEKVQTLNGFYYRNNEIAKQHGYKSDETQIGLSAQEVKAVFPQIVKLAPFDTDYDEEQEKFTSISGQNYLTLDYSKLVPVLIEAIKELSNRVKALEELEKDS
jgi:hypothetical protein